MRWQDPVCKKDPGLGKDGVGSSILLGSTTFIKQNQLLTDHAMKHGEGATGKIREHPQSIPAFCGE